MNFLNRNKLNNFFFVLYLTKGEKYIKKDIGNTLRLSAANNFQREKIYIATKQK